MTVDQSHVFMIKIFWGLIHVDIRVSYMGNKIPNAVHYKILATYKKLELLKRTQTIFHIYY